MHIPLKKTMISSLDHSGPNCCSIRFSLVDGGAEELEVLVLERVRRGVFLGDTNFPVIT